LILPEQSYSIEANMKTLKDRSMKRVIFILSITAAVLSGCMSPAPVFTLVPAENEIQWMNGIGFVDKTDQGVSVRTGFIENQNDLLCFDVSIENNSERTVLLDPKNFECIDQTTHKLDAYERSSLAVPLHALDPETRIQEIEIKLSKENENYQSLQSLQGVGALLNLVLDFSFIVHPPTDEERKMHEQIEEDARYRQNEHENQHIQNVKSLNQEKYFWQTEALRKTTLQPAQIVAGKVFFQRQMNAKLLKFRCSIGPACIEMCFTQKKIKP
jgi:hypothetical protein